MGRRFTILPILAVLYLVLARTPASGNPEDESAFHLIKIVEVFPGTVLQPNAQFVELQAYFAGQSFTSGHRIYFFNAAGAKVDSVTLGNMANGADQMTILIATASAQALFAVSANANMPAAINPAGGKVCFDATNIDCFAWGNYTGSPAGVGTPFQAAFGMFRGKSAKRRLDISGGATTLEATDDTQDSENDFNPGLPSPKNNAGSTGVTPPSTCGNGVIEGLEQCDDGNLTAGDGCNSTCDDEYCGDGVVQTGETCDDGNLTAGDGCDPVCQLEPVCGNFIVEAGEECDDGNLINGDGCDAQCQLEPVCGNFIVEAGETCDDGNLINGDGCDAQCQIEPVCGNSILEAGEECDDGNLNNGDGCDAFCQFENTCGNLIVEPGEECDDGNTNPGDGCDQFCQNEASCPVTLAGDVNNNGTITTADIIALVNYVLKSGLPPVPCIAAGDINCSGTTTTADIIALVNFVLKSGLPPCDVCTLVPGTWSCP